MSDGAIFNDTEISAYKTIAEQSVQITRLRVENERLRVELAEYIFQAYRGHQTMVAEACELRKEIHRLREALKPFAELGEMVNSYEPDDCEWEVTSGMLRAAAAAIGENGND